jgi:hypothetical protein
MAKSLSGAIGELAMERIAALLAEPVADRVVRALTEAGFDQQFANRLSLALTRELEEERR